MPAHLLSWFHPFALAGRTARAPFWAMFFVYVTLLGEVTISFQDRWVGVVGLLPGAVALLPQAANPWSAGFAWAVFFLQFWGALCVLAGAVRRLRDAGHTYAVLSGFLLAGGALLAAWRLDASALLVIWPLELVCAILGIWLVVQLAQSGQRTPSRSQSGLLF